MSVTKLTSKYHCYNDCELSGCPGHEATLELESVSDTWTFNDGRGNKISLQPPELEALMHMLNSPEVKGWPIEHPTVVNDWLNELGLTIDDLDRGSTNTYRAWIRTDTAGEMMFDLRTKRGNKAQFHGLNGVWTRVEGDK